MSRILGVVSRNLRCRGEDFRRSVVAGTSRSSRRAFGRRVDVFTRRVGISRSSKRAFGRRVDVFTRRVGISRSPRRLCTSGLP